MIDVKSVLESLATQVSRPPAEDIDISSDVVRKYAESMAAKGYLHSESSILAIEKYLQGYNLWLNGDCGTGKTLFFKRLNPRIKVFRMIDTTGISIDELREWMEDARNKEIMIDDIGVEPIFNYYGNRFEIFPWIVEKRLEVTARTHLTSNLTAKAMAERYGRRALDRLLYFKKITFKGESKRTPLRKTAGNADLRHSRL